MHWNPEHAHSLSQWPEQHLDVSSTTSSPAHKPDVYAGRSRASYSYAWASDDISALTASNLLKRYAEKYSAVLDSPYERAPPGSYPEPGAFGALNGGQKSEPEAWPLSHGAEGPYPLPPTSAHDGLTGAKAVPAPPAPPGSGSLSDSSYGVGGSCGEFPPSYNGTYLSSAYCPQPAALHALQPSATLVPGYTPSAPVYNYPPGSYAHQSSLAPAYSHPTAPYLPSGLAAPTPAAPAPLASRPTVVGGGYGYQSTEGAGPLKRKAFEMTQEEEDGAGSRYRKYGYDPTKLGGDAAYTVGDKGECRGNGFSSSGSDTQGFKASKPVGQVALGGEEEGGKYGGMKPLVSPPYGTRGSGDYSPPAAITGETGGAEQGLSQLHPHKRAGLAVCSQPSESMKGAEPRLLELVGGELLDCGPTLPWAELLGHTRLKAALEEEVLWPVLRPEPTARPPRTLLLFGPRGGGKTTLARSMASQLGATLYRISAATLASKWKAEAEPLLMALFSATGARAPAVVLLSEVEVLEDGARQRLQAQLGRAAGPLLLVCTTRRPDLLKEPLLRCFARRFHVALPDPAARRHVLLQALGPQGCALAEPEMAAVVQRSDGFSVQELLQLCRRALASAPPGLHPGPALTDFENAFCKVRAHGTPKELDPSDEWMKVYSH